MNQEQLWNFCLTLDSGSDSSTGSSKDPRLAGYACWGLIFALGRHLLWPVLGQIDPNKWNESQLSKYEEIITTLYVFIMFDTCHIQQPDG